MSLTERQAKILEGVCQEYIKNAFPISSQFLKEKYNFSCSSATIRNEFALLEKDRYLSHPYVSAGRIPTDKGYRFFVDRVLERGEFKDFRDQLIKEEILKLQALRDILKISQQFTKILSQLSSNLVLTYFPEEEVLWKEGWEVVIKEPEFQDIQYWKEFLEGLQDFERNIDKLDWEKKKVKVYIGKENPFRKKTLSTVITKTPFFQKREVRVAILGPKRMDFKRNICLINSLIKIMEEFN
jgi:transcriptional regulator of heat shock response